MCLSIWPAVFYSVVVDVNIAEPKPVVFNLTTKLTTKLTVTLIVDLKINLIVDLIVTPYL
jgi:hypothetical protein